MEPLASFTMPALIDRSVRLFGKHAALGFVGETALTYQDMKKQIEEVSGFLHDRGISPGDRVAILGENSPQWGIAYYAVTCMGAIIVPILPEFHASDIQHIIRHSGASALFVSERYFQKVEELEIKVFKTVVLLDTLSVIESNITRTSLRRILAEGGKGLSMIGAFVRRIAGVAPAVVKEDDICSIIYTSGTMGRSKGVMLTHRNVIWNADASAKIPPVTKKDRLLSILPLAHVYECTLGLVLPIMQGAVVWYLRKPPTPSVLLPALAEVKPTTMLTVPLIIEKIYKNRILPELEGKRVLRALCLLPGVRRAIIGVIGKKLRAMFGGHLTFFGIGGAALSPEVEKFLREAKFPYAIGYGLTETSPLIAGANAEHTRFRSTGPIVPGLEVKIDSPDPTTGEGEILVRGESIMKGYYHDEDATAAVLSADGWLQTGDLGYFDKDGYLYIKGRLKNVILGSSGENIYPETVEAVINRAPFVVESLVLKQGKHLVARVQLDYEKLDAEYARDHLSEPEIRKRIELLLEKLRKDVNHQVASFSRLHKMIEQTEPFEKTPTQKIKRFLYT
ncbi:MAG: long-chain acyl-CoA synthetase [Nitrospirae bacterium]|nr:MAG: long-chain acyl-CoA synthetase [Nitrospirota bacterium]